MHEVNWIMIAPSIGVVDNKLLAEHFQETQAVAKTAS